MISSHTAVTATILATDEETFRMLLNTEPVADPELDSSTEASSSTNHSSGTDSGYASGDETRLATIGGLIKILAWDNTHIFYGMTAGHVFATNEDDDRDCRSEESDFRSDDDEIISSDEEDTFELDLPSHQSGGSSAATNVHDDKYPEGGMMTWSILGRLLETSKNSDEDGKNFDWALFAIEDPLLYYSMVSTDHIHKLGEKGELCEPNPVNFDTRLERDVFLSGGTSGVKEGTMSTVFSYLNLEPGRSLIETYTVTFTDKTGMVPEF
jgi:hypothetical protein